MASRRPYQVKDEQLTPQQRDHLYNNLFPLMRDLKRKARARLEEQRRGVSDGKGRSGDRTA